MEILYSDKSLVVCVKEPGVLSQEDASGNINLVTILKDEIKSEIFPVHRLDRLVGGVMVYAKTKKAAAFLSEIVSDKDKFTKIYLAVTEGETEEEGILKDLIYKSSKDNKAYVVKKMRKGVKEGVLEYERVEVKECNSKILSLNKVKLLTGRFHQIRVQFAARKHPLSGDGKYGSKDNKCSVALWSHKIKFPHPGDGRLMEFTSLPDKGSYPWNLFEKI